MTVAEGVARARSWWELVDQIRTGEETFKVATSLGSRFKRPNGDSERSSVYTFVVLPAAAT